MVIMVDSMGVSSCSIRAEPSATSVYVTLTALPSLLVPCHSPTSDFILSNAAFGFGWEAGLASARTGPTARAIAPRTASVSLDRFIDVTSMLKTVGVTA